MGQLTLATVWDRQFGNVEMPLYMLEQPRSREVHRSTITWPGLPIMHIYGPQLPGVVLKELLER